jgi:hypothetical protein
MAEGAACGAASTWEDVSAGGVRAIARVGCEVRSVGAVSVAIAMRPVDRGDAIWRQSLVNGTARVACGLQASGRKWALKGHPAIRGAYTRLGLSPSGHSVRTL